MGQLVAGGTIYVQYSGVVLVATGKGEEKVWGGCWLVKGNWGRKHMLVVATGLQKIKCYSGGGCTFGEKKENGKKIEA